MRAPISVVIPTLNAGGELSGCLAALGEGLERGLLRELIISDGGSRDATLAIAEAAGARVIEGPPGRGGQLMRGAETCMGEWLLVVHADTRLGAGWAGAAEAHMRSMPDSGAYFSLRFRAAGMAPALVAGWANARARYLGLPYGDQGLLLPRRLYDAAGGFADIPLMEDVALVRAVRRAGGRLFPLSVPAHTGAGRYLEGGWVRRGAANLMLLGRYLAGADPERLALDYERHRRAGSGDSGGA